MPSTSAPRSGYFPALDGVRALAILLVIPHNLDALSAPFSVFTYSTAVLFHAGWIGVQLFFVLSGFLITGKLLDARGTPDFFSHFFMRRVLRIFPLYFAVLALLLIVVPWFAKMPEAFYASEHHQVWLWTFLSNWVQPSGHTVYGFSHFWSLAVEEQFYLLWPLLVWRMAPEALLRICLLIALLALLARIVLAGLHFPPEALYMYTVCRMDALALGGAAAAAIRIPAVRDALVANTSKLIWIAIALLILVAGATHAYNAYDLTDQTVGYLLLSVAFALIVLGAVLPTSGVPGRIFFALTWKPLRLIGRYSFAMYVFHFPLHIFVGEPLLRRFGPTTHAIALSYTAGMILATFILGALSYHFFERHFLRMKSSPAPAPQTV